ncbi:MAG TPA: serine/threonine-protein kinase [Gemmatimonadales bacterium]|nr:serine/threonine-protein kinase [Gemmatimonadales bacterium]
MTLPGLAEALAGRYRIERELGRGGMGVVYLARELNLDRAVALKVLPPELAASPELRERFLREARTAALLSHPNIVPIHHAAEAAGFAFFAMGFVDGGNLAEHLRDRGRLSPAEAVRVLREAAWALAYAHARGVVHRDVKPENVMLERATGRVLLTDFGIARDERVTPLTEHGRVMGSVHYMSPEQSVGEPVDGRSDLYALGVIGFQALAGRLPFTAEAPGAVLVMHATRPAPPVRDAAPDVPPALARVIDRCLAKAPADRYATGEALADALTGALEADRTPAAGSASARVLSPDEAQAVWLRAAQLQQDAASRIREKTRELEAAGMATASYRLQDVVSAAAEVGIGQEYVQLALTELPAAAAARPAAPPSARAERLATVLLGTSDRSLRVARTIAAPAARVLEALGRVVTAPPYQLELVDTVGGHPLDGGVLQFHRALGMNEIASAMGSSVNMFVYRLYQLELEDLRITLRPLGADRAHTEVVVYGDLRPGMRKNLLASHGVAASAGVVGAGIAAVVGVKALALGAAMALLPAAPVALAAAAGSYGLYRLSYRGALKGASREIDQMLLSVERALRLQQVFGGTPPAPPAPPPAGSGMNDLMMLLS